MIFLLLLPTPLWASCASAFRTGITAFNDAAQTLSATEDTLYAGLGWASRARVLEKLEDRSTATTACTEIGILRSALIGAQRQIELARTQFTLAFAQCTGENQRGAQGNLDALNDTASDIDTQAVYLADLATRCDTS